MSGHLTEDQFQKYKERKIPTSELLAIGDHLAECKECREKLGGAEERAAILHALIRDLQSAVIKGPEHLTYKQIASYVDGTMNPAQLEIVQSHLEGCIRCKSEWEDLGKYRKELKSEQPLRKLFAAAIPLQNKFTAILPRVIGITATFLLFGLLVAIPFQFQINKLKGQLRNSNATKAEVQDGNWRISVDETGAHVWSLTKFSPEQEQFLRTALVDQRLSVPPFVHELIGTGQGNLKSLSPAGTAVLSDHPNFKWSSLPLAKSYKVRIYDANHNRVAESLELTDISWISQTALERGKNYSWTVTAKLDSREIPTAPFEAKFRILNQKEADEIKRQQQQYADSHLLLALLYVHDGLIEDAEQEFQEFKKANPDSTIADNLLRNLQSLRSN